MSVLQCNFYSKYLMNYVDVTVYLPSMHNGDVIFHSLDELYEPGRKFRSIYLLHGMLDDHSCWMRWSRVEEYAEKHQIALVMPTGQNGFYINAVHGLPYFDFINQELPMWAENTFPLLEGRENRFVAGLSMGGFGALRHGLTTPERYAAIGAFSPVCDLVALNNILNKNNMADMVAYDDLFGGIDKIKGTNNDLMYLAENVKQVAQNLPKIYIGCGKEDVLVYEMTRDYVEFLVQAGYDVTYMEMTGTHEWDVWNTCIREFIEMIDN